MEEDTRIFAVLLFFDRGCEEAQSEVREKEKIEC
jgi:hypothetical protein